MDPDSTAGTSDFQPIPSNKCSNVDEDYISKLLGFEDNYSTEAANASDANRTMPDDQLKTNHDQVAPEETSEFKFMNGHYKVPKGDESLDENHEDIHLIEMDNGFNLAKKIKELMQMKKEADALHEKWEQTEKEKSELQFQVNLLQAENHQFKHLKNQKDENSQKVNELQKDLANKLKAQLKLRNEIESCNLQISEKNDAIKKMKKDNKSLWNMVTRFARKLADADLLTPKEKNTVKKYGEENHILVDTFDSEEEEKIFLSALSYGVQQKPKTLTETQWKHCNNVFSKYLTVEFLTNVSETIPYLMSAIEDKCMSAPYENEYLLMGPLVIYARVKGWSWALEYLLEDYVLPNLEAYSNKENGERAFAFFTNLCADICYGCPNEELSRSCLMKYWKSSGEENLYQFMLVQLC
ncbi:unnamed protein product [Larinioides sclopetarius]|uniref:FRIGIDA-like protein n=1 Tax=Larinioides sclopetarius TaxID=280406 RepID=A0AAV1Z997_9ARAC